MRGKRKPSTGRNLLLLLVLSLVAAACGGATNGGAQETTTTAVAEPGTTGTAETTTSAGATTTPSGEVIEITMAVTNQPTDPMFKAVERYGEALAERSDGRIQLTALQGAQIGGEADQFEAVKNGTIQMTSVGFMGNEKLESMLLPYVFGSQEHQKVLLESDLGQSWIQELEEQAGTIKWIGFAYQNARHLTTNGIPVRTPDDVAGLNIRVPQFRPLLLAWETLGANPEAMPINEVFFALQQGVFDAQENPMEQIVGNSFYEVQDHLILLGYSRPILHILMNESVWESLSPDDQQLFIDTWREMRDLHQEENATLENEYIDLVRNEGMTVIEDADIAAFEAATAEAVREYADTVWGEGVYEQVVAMNPEG